MVANVQELAGSGGLRGRTVYIPQMAYAGARLMAAAFRSVGIDATVAPDSDTQTLELGGLHSSGEECLPHKVTLGDFLKVCRAPGFDPRKAAFFMPTAHGPCRFGQYAPYLRHQLAQMGYGDVPVISPSSENGYEGVGLHARELMRTAWMGVICGDIVTKFLLKTRPYEMRAGDADAEFERGVEAFGRVLAVPGLAHRERLSRLTDVVVQTRDRFRAIPAKYEKGRPLIGLVGEIFCRLNTFSNDAVARRIERHGGECWLSDIAEWIWYTNWCQRTNLVRDRGRLNPDFVRLKLKTFVQRRYEHALLAPVAEDFAGYEEPHDVAEVLAESEAYLPPQGCLGEMVLSVGKAILDISPFTCMNGIICEAVYPAVSAEHDDLPIRICYFDGVNTNIDRDLEIFLDLARAYQKRKKHVRVYPACFG